MPDITAAADQVAASKLLAIAEAALGKPPAQSGTANLGPISVSYTADASFSGGTVSLSPPNVIGIAGCNMVYSVTLSLTLDFSKLVGQICIPQVCVKVFGHEICTPQICIPFPPPITVPVTVGDTVTFTNDFHLNPHLAGSDWLIDVVINGIPKLQFGAGTAAALLAIGTAVTTQLAPMLPYGPIVAFAVDILLAGIGVAGLEGFLGPILTPFVQGLTFTIYKQPQLYPAIPAAGPFDPVVNVTITALDAVVQATDKNELVITASIAS